MRAIPAEFCPPPGAVPRSQTRWRRNKTTVIYRNFLTSGQRDFQQKATKITKKNRVFPTPSSKKCIFIFVTFVSFCFKSPS